MNGKGLTKSDCPLSVTEWVMVLRGESSAVATQFLGVSSVGVGCIAIVIAIMLRFPDYSEIIWLGAAIIAGLVVYAAYAFIKRIKHLRALADRIMRGDVTMSNVIRDEYFKIPLRGWHA